VASGACRLRAHTSWTEAIFDHLHCRQAGLEEARASQLEALVGSLRSAAYRAAADSQAHGSHAAGAASRSAQLQAGVLLSHPCLPLLSSTA
jgi:hypothetical protein